MHRQFEELCALAATGQIHPEAMMLLDQHLKNCENCRAFLEAIVPLKVHVAPVLAASHAYTYQPPDGMRERFLQRAKSRGIALRPGPVLSNSSRDHDSEATATSRVQPIHHSLIYWSQKLFRFAVPIAASILCGLAGYWLASHKPQIQSKVAHVLPTPVPTESDSAGVDSRQLEKLRQESADSRAQIENLKDDLGRARLQRHELNLRLETAAKEATKNAQFQAKYQAATLELQSADEKISKLLADLATERNRVYNADSVLLAQQRATDEANAKVAALDAQLQSPPNLADNGQATELISARNLHIVDVYDSDSDGNRKKAFGRVFYVEGKSLVFYAYGLPEKPSSKEVQFRVWGEQAGVKSVSINLGTMHSDDPAQSRWVLRCNEPKVLAKINAIYITADPHSHPTSDSHGPKMMYAFLGSANHP